MRRVSLDLLFKGSRKYLHGTDMFDYVRTFLQDATGTPLEDFEIAFHYLATKPLDLTVGSGLNNSNAAATGSYVSAEGKVPFCLTETEGEVLGRRPYLEEDIIACTTFSEDRAIASLTDNLTFTDIEVWVAMIKALHMRLFPDAEGKWLFVRAKMGAYASHSKPSTYSVTLASRFGHKLTRSEVRLKDTKVGDVFFALM